jgi:hypothetical protein
VTSNTFETTNLEAKYTALQLAVALNDLQSLASVLQSFAATERNFVLKKGETTVDVERTKLDAGSHGVHLRAVTDLLEKVKPTRGS